MPSRRRMRTRMMIEMMEMLAVKCFAAAAAKVR
jgi:hypothetical protein